MTVLDGIISNTISTSSLKTQPKIVLRPVTNLPATTQTPYFTVTGRVLITQLVGEVVGVCNGVATNIKLISNPTVGADVDLCSASASVANNAIGTIYTITGTLADASSSDATQTPIAPTNSVDVSGNTNWFGGAPTINTEFLMSRNYYY